MLMKAIILAAGKGERLGPLTKRIPKPLIPIAGKPVLEHLIKLCKKNNIFDIGINTSYLSDKIRNYFGTGENFGVNLSFSYEPSLLGTSGTLNNFRDFLDDPEFLVIYGDNITNLNLKEMINAHKKHKAFGTLYLYHETMSDSNTTPGYVIINEKGFVKEIIENPTEEQKKDLEAISEDYKFTNAGIYVLNKKILDFIPEGKSDFAKQILPEVLKKGMSLLGYRENCYIKEIGQMHRYRKAKEEIESGRIIL